MLTVTQLKFYIKNAIAFQVKLDSDTLHLGNVDSLIGKDVMITIVEMPIQEEQVQSKE